MFDDRVIAYVHKKMTPAQIIGFLDELRTDRKLQEELLECIAFRDWILRGQKHFSTDQIRKIEKSIFDVSFLSGSVDLRQTLDVFELGRLYVSLALLPVR